RLYGIVGPKGSGKTTILKIFMGTVKPDSGYVARMGDYKYPTLQSSYVSQEGQLNLKKNAIWNVKKAHRTASKGRAIEELSRFLTEEEMNIPTGQLSLGKQRIVEIVKSLFIPSDFIVFDEPFEGMTDEEHGAVLDYVMSKRESRPLIIASVSEPDIKNMRVMHLS
ncbi:MAG: ATP-binding cassette domain-containing protein, partial [Lachnospiraceae bacterium]|nr:ATP-binding cassette domain-containing protein [Lachnospiraceae bacterium]